MEVKEILYRFIYDIKDEELQRLNSILSKVRQDAGETRSVVEDLYNVLSDPPEIDQIDDDTSPLTVPVDFQFDVPEIDVEAPDMNALNDIDQGDDVIMGGVPTPAENVTQSQPDIEAPDTNALLERNTEVRPTLEASSRNYLSSEPLNTPQFPMEIQGDVGIKRATDVQEDMRSEMNLTENIQQDSRIAELSNKLSSSFNKVMENNINSVINSFTEQNENFSVNHNLNSELVEQGTEGTENIIQNMVQGSGSATMDIGGATNSYELNMGIDGSIDVNYEDPDTRDVEIEETGQENQMMESRKNYVENTINLDLNSSRSAVLDAENNINMMLEERNQQDTMIQRNVTRRNQAIYQEQVGEMRQGSESSDMERDIIAEVTSAIESMVIDYGTNMQDPMEAQKQTRRYVDRTVHDKLQEIYRDVRR